jgi:hypothetical protein
MKGAQIEALIARQQSANMTYLTLDTEAIY